MTKLGALFFLICMMPAFAQENHVSPPPTPSPTPSASNPSASAVPYKEFLISEQTVQQLNAALLEVPMKYAYPIMLILQKGLRPNEQSQLPPK